MNWKYFKSNFEFIKDLPIESSAWSGHYFFAYDLVRNTKPKIIVELGTHKGNSLFSMAQAVKDGELNTTLHPIDTWQGDSQAGFYGEEIYNDFIDISKQYYKEVELIPFKMLFDEAIKKFKDNSIDILHIDGLHTYKAVKHDFETWLPKVKKDTGIIMLHDVCETKGDFGVYKLWKELQKKYKNTITFEHYHGLGVIFLGEKEINLNKDLITLTTRYYSTLSKVQDIEKDVFNKEIHIRNITKQNIVQLNREKREEKKYKSEIEKYKNETEMYKIEAEEYKSFKQTKIWKGLTIYRKLKKYTKNFLINMRKDGPIKTFQRIYQRINKIIKYRKQRKIDQNRYKYWLIEHELTKTKKREIQKEISQLEYQPLISIIMPVYNVDIKWIKEAVKSVENQIYTNWELCIADDASTKPELRKYLENIRKDKKIKIIFRKKNGHISEASNSAIKLAKGEYIALMDNDDIIYPHSLAEVVKVLNRKPKTDLIYSDEDKLDMNGKRVEPFFKPNWSPDLFLSTNYLCHLTIIRKSLLDKVGGFRKGYEGSQDYDLFLRIAEQTRNIEHIPDILYSWRKIPGSTASVYSEKSYAEKTSINSLKESLKRQRIGGIVSTGLFPGSFRVQYKIKDEPLVSILIPTKDKFEYINRCIDSVLEKTTYSNYEIIIIDTGTTDKKALRLYEEIKNNPRFKIVYWKKQFNYSAVNNLGVKNSQGEYIVLLNNDTEVITPDWIEGMLEHAQRDEIGAVGAKLLYPDDRIQHAGVVLGINGGTGKGVAGHAFKFFPREVQGFPVQKDIIKNYSAVTAACLMISKKKYEEVKGLNEDFRIAFNDVDFCLKILERGYYNVYTPYVELYHHESISVGRPEDNTRDNKEFGKEIEMMYARWEKQIINDTYYNPNLSKSSESFLIEIKN